MALAEDARLRAAGDRSRSTAGGSTAPDQMIRPDLQVMLEDVRTRGDRQHPFWARMDGPTARSGVSSPM